MPFNPSQIKEKGKEFDGWITLELHWLPLKLTRAITFASFAAIAFCMQACTPKSPIMSPSAKENEPARSSNKEAYPDTYIYRHLTAVRDYSPDVDSVWNLCIRQHQFRDELPTTRVISARAISIPAKETSYVEAKVTKYRQKQVTKYESKFGIQLEPTVENISIPYEETEVQPRTTKGTCVGSEYILSD
jgi:hypothetical protein